MTHYFADASRVHGPNDEVVFRSITQATMREMTHHLDDLKVPYPPIGLQTVERLRAWLVFLPRVLAASRAGKLKHARTIWPDMQKDGI